MVFTYFESLSFLKPVLRRLTGMAAIALILLPAAGAAWAVDDDETVEICSAADAQDSGESPVRVKGGEPKGFVVEGNGLRILPGYRFQRLSARKGVVPDVERGNTGTISCDCTGDGGGCTVTLKDGKVFCEHGGCSSGCITDISIPTGDSDQRPVPGRRKGPAPARAKPVAAGAAIKMPDGPPAGLTVKGDRAMVKPGFAFHRISDLAGEILDKERDGTGTVTCEPCGGTGSCTLSYQEGALFCSKSCDKACGMVIAIPSQEGKPGQKPRRTKDR